ncbi:hypothetical protein [Bacillus cereus]
MKIYKKVITLAPMAALSTSLLFSPSMTFAAEKQEPIKTAQTSNAENQSSTIIEFGGDSIYLPPHSLVTVTYKTNTGECLSYFTFSNFSNEEITRVTPTATVTASDTITSVVKEITTELL